MSLLKTIIKKGRRNIKAALYCRISKEDETENESESILNQKSLLENYCLEKGYDIYKIYVDEDYSGIRDDRPAFNEMLYDAENKKFQIVLCKTLSRFSRDMAVVENYINNKFAELGIRFISVVDNADSYDKTNKKTRQINSLINEWYLEDLSENIRAVFKNKMKKGECLFAFAPYGYKKDPECKNRLVKDVNTFETVEKIYWLYNFGCGIGKIAAILNNDGVVSPLNYRRNIKESNWTGGTVKDILTNPVYTGDMVQNRKNKLSYKSKKRIPLSENEWIRVEDTHERIISKELYNLTQIILKKGYRSEKNGYINPLGSLFQCECGGKCIKKTKRVKCVSCSKTVELTDITQNLKKKLGVKKENKDIFFCAAAVLIDKIIINKKYITVVWKEVD